MKPAVAFFNGQQMPIVGLGTWLSTDPAALESALNTALEIGYRHIDTAYVYKNEDVVGSVLKKWMDSDKIKREELFVVTKLPGIGMQKDKVEHFLSLSLKKLQLDYVDLYLIHSPVGMKYVSDEEYFPKSQDGSVDLDFTTNHEEIWKAMEHEVDKGRTKSIGLSNFNSKQIERIMKFARIQPANLQIELNAYFQQKPLREICKMCNITVCAYGPIGSPGRKAYFKNLLGIDFEAPPLLNDLVVVNLAQKHKKTAAHILLRFLTQSGIAVIPKSSNSTRVQENFDIFDFELSDEEMREIELLDKGADGRTFKFSLWGNIAAHPENPEAVPY